MAAHIYRYIDNIISNNPMEPFVLTQAALPNMRGITVNNISPSFIDTAMQIEQFRGDARTNSDEWESSPDNSSR